MGVALSRGGQSKEENRSVGKAQVASCLICLSFLKLSSIAHMDDPDQQVLLAESSRVSSATVRSSASAQVPFHQSDPGPG